MGDAAERYLSRLSAALHLLPGLTVRRWVRLRAHSVSEKVVFIDV
jgi:hypothetical protein